MLLGFFFDGTNSTIVFKLSIFEIQCLCLCMILHGVRIGAGPACKYH